MVTRKARNFILLSRSGAEGNETARQMIDDMRKTGVQIEAPRCDVTDEQAVSSVLKGYGQLLPPIKGCIQASMVLKVRDTAPRALIC